MILSRKLANLLIEKKVSVLQISDLLTKYKLLALLPQIKNIVLETSSRNRVSDTLAIESPFLLSEDVVAHIKKITGNEKSSHIVTVNKKILAGFKARYKGKLYDGSAERIIRDFMK